MTTILPFTAGVLYEVELPAKKVKWEWSFHNTWDWEAPPWVPVGGMVSERRALRSRRQQEISRCSGGSLPVAGYLVQQLHHLALRASDEHGRQRAMVVNGMHQRVDQPGRSHGIQTVRP